MNDKRDEYTIGEEIANAVTHGAGTLLSVAALVLMVVFASYSADPWRIVGVSVFGTSLIMLYLASTLYHSLSRTQLRDLMRIFDHCAIYFLIAGTYTPFLLVSLRGPWGWTLFAVLWGATVVGCVFKAFCIGRLHKVTTFLYLAMGWTILVAIKPAMEAVPVGAVVLMLIGGLAYSFGVIFYLWDRLPYNHAIWHLFVMAGSTAHFIAVFIYFALMRA